MNFLKECKTVSDQYLLQYNEEECICRPAVTNNGDHEIKLNEVILFKGHFPFQGDTQLYGEGFNMMAQSIGTIDHIEPLPGCTDAGHYKLPSKHGYYTMYNYILIHPKNYILIGFTTCNSFVGEFRIGENKEFEIALNMEGIILKKGQTRQLEEICILENGDRESVLAAYAQMIQQKYNLSDCAERYTGWCSWYGYWENITEESIIQNLTAIKEKKLNMKYIQLDYGYQDKLGDWLINSDKFPSGIKAICDTIQKEGFEPALWVAPFIAELGSKVFREHPDWFISDGNHLPLTADKVTFAGWSNPPWVMLDPTNKEAYEYIKHVFYVMRHEWNCKYFKLDANMWGALPFGNRSNPDMTSVEAYRLGMKAIREGAGDDSFILGCNAPMWQSIGTVDGMRVTSDIERVWDSVKTAAVQAFPRNWQNNRLWSNDPDCVILSNYTQIIGREGIDEVMRLSDDEFKLHIAYILASGGMLLSGDVIPELSEEKTEILKRLLSETDQAAPFADFNFDFSKLNNKMLYFNFKDTIKTVECPVEGIDWFTGEKTSNQLIIPPHSAKIIYIK